jgi:hypothetical protein
MNDLCQECLSKEDRKKAINVHSMNKSRWRKACIDITEKYQVDLRQWTQDFLMPYTEELNKFGIDATTDSNYYWYPHYANDVNYEIEEHEVKDA